MTAPAPPSVLDPLAGSPWSVPATVASFARSSPNEVLMRFAVGERRGVGRPRALDLGCGAGRNALPLARAGWEVLGIDLSWPMLSAAGERAGEEGLRDSVELALAPMDRVPAPDRCFDLVVAHGIWNLARSGAEFRRALREASRVARPGAGLFVFTFSRNTLCAEARPVHGETFVFTEFSGSAHCFLTEEQLLYELGSAGFVADPAVPLTEHNRRPPGALHAGGPPVIYEAAFRRVHD